MIYMIYYDIFIYDTVYIIIYDILHISMLSGTVHYIIELY